MNIRWALVGLIVGLLLVLLARAEARLFINGEVHYDDKALGNLTGNLNANYLPYASSASTLANSVLQYKSDGVYINYIPDAGEFSLSSGVLDTIYSSRGILVAATAGLNLSGGTTTLIRGVMNGITLYTPSDISSVQILPSSLRLNTGVCLNFSNNSTQCVAASIFNQVLNTSSNVVFNNLTVANLNVTGHFSAKRPYGMFSCNYTQNLSVVNTSYAVAFNIVEDSYLVNKVGNTNFTFNQSGDYLIELSAVFEVDGTPANKHPEIWVRKNGVDVANSNTKTELFNNGAEQVVSVPFIMDMVPTDIFQVMWAGDATYLRMKYTNATYYSPAVPSIIMTISKISEITE